MKTYAHELGVKTPLEVRNGAVDCIGKLDPGELLSGTPVIDPIPGYTFSDINVSTSVLNINKVDVPAGQAIQFSVSGGLVKTNKKNDVISIRASTDSSPPQTISAKLPIFIYED